MIVALVAMGIMICCFGFFSLAYQINGLNRIIIYTPLTIIEKNVRTEGDYPLYFNWIMTQDYLLSYYQNKTKQYCDNCDINFYFYNQKNHSYCIGDYCNAVEIEFDADLYLNYHYHRKIYFEVRNSNELS